MIIVAKYFLVLVFSGLNEIIYRSYENHALGA